MSAHALLSDLIASSEGISTDLTHRHISYTLFQLLCKVARLHSTGLVHGDICPENVRISRDGTTELLEDGTKSAKLSYKAPEFLLEMPITSEEVPVRRTKRLSHRNPLEHAVFCFAEEGCSVHHFGENGADGPDIGLNSFFQHESSGRDVRAEVGSVLLGFLEGFGPETM
uniref:Protein kinase domain-containing protein n=1 Tax=Steinernema glaseri TaxID=37863 RepID=A0A1I7ZHD3_9BILA